MQASTTERMTYDQARQRFEEQKATARRVLRDFLRDIPGRSWARMTDDDRARAAAILVSELPVSIAAEFLNEASPSTDDDLHLLVRLIEVPNAPNAGRFWQHFRRNAIEYARSYVQDEFENLRDNDDQ